MSDFFLNFVSLFTRYLEQPKDTVLKDACEKTFKPSLKTVEEDLMEANNIVETRKPAKTYWY